MKGIETSQMCHIVKLCPVDLRVLRSSPGQALIDTQSRDQAGVHAV